MRKQVSTRFKLKRQRGPRITTAPRGVGKGSGEPRPARPATRRAGWGRQCVSGRVQAALSAAARRGRCEPGLAGPARRAACGASAGPGQPAAAGGRAGPASPASPHRLAADAGGEHARLPADSPDPPLIFPRRVALRPRRGSEPPPSVAPSRGRWGAAPRAVPPPRRGASPLPGGKAAGQARRIAWGAEAAPRRCPAALPRVGPRRGQPAAGRCAAGGESWRGRGEGAGQGAGSGVTGAEEERGEAAPEHREEPERNPLAARQAPRG